MSRSSFVPFPGATAGCPNCRGQGYVVEADGEWAHARRCDCVDACTLCEDTGYELVRGEGRRAARRRCRCHTVLDRMTAYNGARVPARYAHCTRASFQRKSKGQRDVFLGVSRYLKAYVPGDRNRGMVLYGDVGRGKTHLATALLRELVFDHGVTARFVEFSHLIADLKYSFDKGTGAADLLAPLVRVDVLLIDELGKGRATEWEGTVLDELVTRRYNGDATILGTSNYAPGDSTGVTAPNLANTAGRRPALVDRVGDRVYSRLMEMCEFVPVVGDDFRAHPERPTRHR